MLNIKYWNMTKSLTKNKILIIDNYIDDSILEMFCNF